MTARERLRGVGRNGPRCGLVEVSSGTKVVELLGLVAYASSFDAGDGTWDRCETVETSCGRNLSRVSRAKQRRC